MHSFWQNLEIAELKERIPMESQIEHLRLFFEVKDFNGRNPSRSKVGIEEKFYPRPLFVDYLGNVCEEYQFYTNKTQPRKNLGIGIDEFNLWIYRLYCIAYDLLWYPYQNDPDKENREKIIKAIINDSQAHDKEYCTKGQWQRIKGKNTLILTMLLGEGRPMLCCY
jgi:hypothetical protein